jgi:hypothetical protein
MSLFLPRADLSQGRDRMGDREIVAASLIQGVWPRAIIHTR